MPFISSMAASKGGRLFGLGAKPAKIGNLTLTSGDATDTFSWSAPNANGLPIIKYGYQVSSDNGSTWYSAVDGTLNGETEVSNTSAILNTQYKLSSYKVRARAYNAAGWGEYSDISSSGTVVWVNNTGTQSQSQTDTSCSTGTCSQGCSCGACSCGSNTGTQTRTASRSRSRSRSTQYYSRTNSTNSSTSYGSWSISDYEWNLGASSSVGWGSLSYSGWGGCTSCTGCSSYVSKTGDFGEYAYTGTPGSYFRFPNPNCSEGCNFSAAFYTIITCSVDSNNNIITQTSSDPCLNAFGDPC